MNGPWAPLMEEGAQVKFEGSERKEDYGFV